MRKTRFYQSVPGASTAVPALLLVLAGLLPALAGPADGAALVDRDGPAYAALRIPPGVTSYPEASLRLVVLRDGAVVLDRGLRDDWAGPAGTGGVSGDGKLFPGPSIQETVEISPDTLTAVLMRTRIEPPGPDGNLNGTTALTWIDAENPRGRWSLDLPAGRFVTHIHVLDGQSGFALMTARPDAGEPDFALYDVNGEVEYRLDEVVGKVLEFRITRAGAFIGLDIAYPDRPGLPDRSILVLDRLQNGRWSYDWVYGDAGEPTDWTLADNGVLELRVPGDTLRFDRTGLQLLPRNRKRRNSRTSN